MATMRAPSLELLRILRRPAQDVTCNRSKVSFQLHRSSRFISASRSKHAEPSNNSRTQPSPATQSRSTASSSASSSTPRRNPYAPTTTDRGPVSKEDTQTDFSAMDIYSNTPEPATSIDACTPGGFHLNNGTKITGGTGVLLAGGEAWSWKPWLGLSISTSNQNTSDTKPRISNLLDSRGLLVIPPSSLGVLKLLHPKPDLLLIGTGSKTLMLHPDSRKYIVDELGMRIDVMDTANASAAYNLLATERGVEGGGGVGGAMLPVGWKGVEVKKR